MHLFMIFNAFPAVVTLNRNYVTIQHMNNKYKTDLKQSRVALHLPFVPATEFIYAYCFYCKFSAAPNTLLKFFPSLMPDVLWQLSYFHFSITRTWDLEVKHLYCRFIRKLVHR